MKTIFISILIFTNFSFAQRTVKLSDHIKISPETDVKESSRSAEKNLSVNKFYNDIKFRLENLYFLKPEFENHKNNSLDLLGNIGSNISFGGFYESFAVLNFTPQLNIKPTGFLNIYANHYLNILIPLSRAKEVSKSILINSISMIALENAADLLFKKNNWLIDIAEFTLKNCLINLFLKPELNNTSDVNERILQFDNFYYSVSITF